MEKTETEPTLKQSILAECAEVERVGMNDLFHFLLTSDYFTAPASTKFHLSKPGGLALHSWNVYIRLSVLAEIYHVEAPKESLILCGLFHDLCKVNFYTTAERNVKNAETGKWEKVPYICCNDQDPLGHGEKSVIVLQRYIRLTEAEQYAIRWHMGAWDQPNYTQMQALNGAIAKCPLLRALHLADLTAAFFEDSRP